MSRLSFMKNITTKISISGRCYQTLILSIQAARKMMQAIPMVITRTIKHKITRAFSPSSFIKNNSYREVL